MKREIAPTGIRGLDDVSRSDSISLDLLKQVDSGRTVIQQIDPAEFPPGELV